MQILKNIGVKKPSAWQMDNYLSLQRESDQRDGITHDDQDELFIIYKGHMTIQLRDKDIELDQDEMFIVPRGVEHCPKAEAEVQFLIVGLNITSNAAGGKPNL